MLPGQTCPYVYINWLVPGIVIRGSAAFLFFGKSVGIIQWATGPEFWGRGPCSHQHGDPFSPWQGTLPTCGLIWFWRVLHALSPNFLACQAACLDKHLVWIWAGGLSLCSQSAGSQGQTHSGFLGQSRNSIMVQSQQEGTVSQMYESFLGLSTHHIGGPQCELKVQLCSCKIMMNTGLEMFALNFPTCAPVQVFHLMGL